MTKASGFTNFTRLGVESKVAHGQNPRLGDIRAPIDRAKSDIGPRDFKRSKPTSYQTVGFRNRD